MCAMLKEREKSSHLGSVYPSTTDLIPEYTVETLEPGTLVLCPNSGVNTEKKGVFTQ